MLFASFKTAEEANKFIKTVDEQELQYHNGEFVVFYNPILSVEEAKKKRIEEQEHKATTQLALQEMDIELLEHMLKVHQMAEDETKVTEVTKQLEQTKASIAAWKAQLAVVEKWKANK